jgi:RNA polymerase-binding transcription factor DksA
MELNVATKAQASKAPATKKAPVKKAVATKKAPVKKAPAKKAPAKKAAVKKAPATKAQASKAPATKKAPVKKAVATKKAPVKKAPVKNAPVKKAAVKAPVKKAAVKKAPAKKAAAARLVASPPRLAEVNALGARSAKKPPAKRTGPLDKFLLEQVEALKEERAVYVHQAAALKAEADSLVFERDPGDVQFDEESGEGDTIAVERERDLTLSAQALAAVEDIDTALEKIKDGVYGWCEQCHSTIPKERLRALPHAALCVQCKSAGFSRR